MAAIPLLAILGVILGITALVMINIGPYDDRAADLVEEMRKLNHDMEILNDRATNAQSNCNRGSQSECDRAWDMWNELDVLTKQWHEKNHEWQKIVTGMT